MVHVVGSEETHLLSATTTAVWNRCDGTTTRDQLEDVFAAQPAEHRADLVQLALDQLEHASLIDHGGNSSDLQRESRRRFLKRAAVAAVAVPTITTIVTAQPAAASSHGCNSSACPGGTVCNPVTGDCVECLIDSNCPTGRVCENNTCKVPFGGFCTSSSQCVSTAPCCKNGQCKTGTVNCA